MIWICIPVFNRLELTKNCISSILTQSIKDYKIVICDDGSTDNTYEYIKTNFQDVILLRGDGNLWWAGAINKCFEYAVKNGKENDYILMLNNDLEVKENYLAELLSNLSEKEMRGSLAKDIDDIERVVYAGELLNNFTAKSLMLHRNWKKYKFEKEWDVDILTGRGTIFPIKLLSEIGSVNYLKMPQYGSDVEFSSRAKKHGYQLKIVSNAIVYSHIACTGSGSVYKKSSLREFICSFFSIKSPNYYKCRYYFAKTYASGYRFPIFLSLNILRICAGFIKRKIMGMEFV